MAELGLTQIEVSEPIIPFLETIVADVQSSYAKIVATHLTVSAVTKVVTTVNCLGMYHKSIQSPLCCQSSSIVH